jgi:hypothetical protein
MDDILPLNNRPGKKFSANNTLGICQATPGEVCCPFPQSVSLSLHSGEGKDHLLRGGAPGHPHRPGQVCLRTWFTNASTTLSVPAAEIACPAENQINSLYGACSTR